MWSMGAGLVGPVRWLAGLGDEYYIYTTALSGNNRIQAREVSHSIHGCAMLQHYQIWRSISFVEMNEPAPSASYSAGNHAIGSPSHPSSSLSPQPRPSRYPAPLPPVIYRNSCCLTPPPWRVDMVSVRALHRPCS
jgi:hypothetical protein